jgi:hypothetical protein
MNRVRKRKMIRIIAGTIIFASVGSLVYMQDKLNYYGNWCALPIFLSIICGFIIVVVIPEAKD